MRRNVASCLPSCVHCKGGYILQAAKLVDYIQEKHLSATVLDNLLSFTMSTFLTKSLTAQYMHSKHSVIDTIYIAARLEVLTVMLLRIWVLWDV